MIGLILPAVGLMGALPITGLGIHRFGGLGRVGESGGEEAAKGGTEAGCRAGWCRGSGAVKESERPPSGGF